MKIEKKKLIESNFSLPEGDIVDWDDDTFAEVYNDIARTISKYSPKRVGDPEQYKKYAEKIHKLMDNDEVKDAIAAEDRTIITAEKNKKKRLKDLEGEKERFKNVTPSMGTLMEFRQDICRTIKEQIEQVKTTRDSYTKMNRKFEGDDIIVKGKVGEYSQIPKIPIIDIFIDCSGSWWNYRNQSLAVAGVLKYFEDRKEIELHAHFCSDRIYPTWDEAIANGYTEPWDEILNTIKMNNSTNVVIMTDHDMEHHTWRTHEHIIVPGHVWFIWKTKRDVCPGVIAQITGQRGTSQYIIES